jgi:starvation-inducible outer membrane lipoprotein
MKKYLLFGTLALLLTGCGGGSVLTLTPDNFNKIHDDMSQADVVGIMGQPTESKTDPIPLVGGTQTTFVYRNDKSEVTIVFKNDQVKERHSNFGQ